MSLGANPSRWPSGRARIEGGGGGGGGDPKKQQNKKEYKRAGLRGSEKERRWVEERRGIQSLHPATSPHV